MKTNNIPKDELIGRNLLSLLVIAGITFSAISFFILDEEIQEVFSYTEVTPVPTSICENGLCYFRDAKETSNHMFVQLEEELYKTQQVLKNEEFTNLKLVKNLPVKAPEISGNKVTLFPDISGAFTGRFFTSLRLVNSSFFKTCCVLYNSSSS